MPEGNIQVLSVVYEAINRGDYETVFDLLDPSIEWQPADSTPFAGTYRGHQAVRELLGTFLEALDLFRWEPEEFFETEQHQVVVFVRQIARGRERGVEST